MWLFAFLDKVLVNKGEAMTCKSFRVINMICKYKRCSMNGALTMEL